MSEETERVDREDGPSNVLDAFLSQYYRDLDAGRSRTVDHYLARFPGADDLIREEHAAVEAMSTSDESFFFADIAGDPLTLAGLPDASAGADATTLFGKWEIVGRIDGGGMGVVYLGVDPEGMKVAIKLALGSWLRGENDKLRQRFMREMRIAAGIRHPNVLSVLETGVLRRSPYLVTEFIPAGSLGLLLEAEKRLPWPIVVDIASDLFAGLEAIHSAGAIHRDIKPSNLLLRPDGKILIADFGLARPDSPDRTLYTSSKRFLGTLDFAAPEQVTGEHEVSTPADLYSAGATLFALLAGRPVHKARSVPAAVDFHLEGTTPDIGAIVTGLPEELVNLITGLLEKDPSRRPATASSCRDLLTALGAARPPVGRSLATMAAAQAKRLEAHIEAASLDALEMSRRPTAGGDVDEPDDERIVLAEGETLIAAPGLEADSRTLRLSRDAPGQGEFRITILDGWPHLEPVEGGGATKLNGRPLEHGRTEPLFGRNEIEIEGDLRFVLRTRREGTDRVGVVLWAIDTPD